MNLLKLLLLKFYILPKKIRLYLIIFGTFLLILTIYFLLRPNPNGWEKISKLGITLPLHYKIHGIDLSHHNGKIEWQKVKKMQFSEEDLRVEFCFLKDRKSTRLNSSHVSQSRMPSSA